MQLANKDVGIGKLMPMEELALQYPKEILYLCETYSGLCLALIRLYDTRPFDTASPGQNAVSGLRVFIGARTPAPTLRSPCEGVAFWLPDKTLFPGYRDPEWVTRTPFIREY